MGRLHHTSSSRTPPAACRCASYKSVCVCVCARCVCVCGLCFFLLTDFLYVSVYVWDVPSQSIPKRRKGPRELDVALLPFLDETVRSETRIAMALAGVWACVSPLHFMLHL